MASQPLYQPFYPIMPATRPSVRVAFSGGAAVLAIRDKLETSPHADKTLDEIEAATASPAVPLRALLAERNAIMTRLNNGPDCTDEEGAALCGQVNLIENEIIGREAVTPDDAVVKLIAAVQVSAEGSELGDIEAAGVISQARRHFGMGYVHQQLLDALPPVPSRVTPLTVGEQLSASRAEWEQALAAYASAHEAWGRIDIDAEHADETLNAMLKAAERLIVEVPAPDAEAISTKFDLAASGSEGFEMPAEFWEAIKTDVQRLLSPQPYTFDPHPGWYAEHIRSQAVINASGELSDAAEDAQFDVQRERLNSMMSTPATTRDGVIAKLAMMVQYIVEGSEPSLDHCASALADCIRVTGMGSLVDAFEKHHRGLAA